MEMIFLHYVDPDLEIVEFNDNKVTLRVSSGNISFRLSYVLKRMVKEGGIDSIYFNDPLDLELPPYKAILRAAAVWVITKWLNS